MRMKVENLIEITDSLEQKLRAAEVISWDDIQYALNNITEEKNKGLYGLVCYYTAYYMIGEGRQDECLFYLKESIRCIQGTDQESEIARCYNLSGVVAHGKSNFVLAMEHYEKARVYAERYNSRIVLMMSIGNMANTYYRVGAFDRAIICYRECIHYLERSGSSTLSMANFYCRILANYGYCLLMTEQVDKAAGMAVKIKELMETFEGNYSVQLAVYTFFTFLAYRTGEMEQAERYVDEAVCIVMKKWVGFIDFDNIMNLIQYLIQVKKLDSLQKILDYMEPQVASERNEGLLLQLLLFRLQYCSEDLDQDSFITYVQTFFNLKSKYDMSENNQVLHIISLRNQLREIEEEQAKLAEENSKLIYQTEHDSLSGLYNKRYLNRHMEDMFEEALQKGIPLGVLFVDIDYFKQMNDRYGHQKGDTCIVAISEAIKTCMPGDFAARYGGDEFVIITLGKSREYLEEKAQMLVNHIKAEKIPNADSEYMNVVTITVGAVHAIPHKPNRMWDFLSAADETLYCQKNEQRGCVRFYNKPGECL